MKLKLPNPATSGEWKIYLSREAIVSNRREARGSLRPERVSVWDENAVWWKEVRREAPEPGR